MMLTATGLYRFFHVGTVETVALRGVSLTLAAGEIVAVMGPSGSGKSTLLHCLAGLDEPDAGMVHLGEAPLSRQPEAVRAALRARQMGILLQGGNLFPHLTIRDNIRFQLHLARRPEGGRADHLLEMMGLSYRGRARAAQLSGGEIARAGLAVALACDPPILIADEPTAEVDAATEARILALFDTRRAAGLATLIATHSEALAHRADRILRLHDGSIAHG